MPLSDPQPNQQGMDSTQIATMQALQSLTAAMNDLRQNLHTSPPFQSKLHDFFSTRPPVFSHSVEPVDANDWLKTIDNKLQISQYVGHERVLYASHQLAGAAADWWTTYIAAHTDLENITWEEFKIAFRNQHVPPGEIKLRRREFLNLKQESMTVREYFTRWTQLSRYCTYD